jgi:polyvinyl alcohol dehydrogenase (cytochrome)
MIDHILTLDVESNHDDHEDRDEDNTIRECRMRSVFTILCLAAVLLVRVDDASAQTPSRVIRLIDQRCAGCHTNPGAGRSPAERAPEPATLRKMTAETIFQAITRGSMRLHLEDVAEDVKRAIAEYLSGRKLGGTEGADSRTMPNHCSTNAPLRDVSGGVEWNGWGPDPTNARFQKAGGISADQVPRLTLKWAFGFPGASSVYGQPTIAGGRLFVGADTGYVYSLDATTGCVYWSFQAETGVRNAISVGPVAALGGRSAVYFGDIRANVYALDATTGEMLWKVVADPHPLAAITGSPTIHDGRLYVPVSSREEAAGGSTNYPCCTFRGSVLALDTNDGRVIWQTHMIPDAARPTRKNSAGTQLWAPAGAAVWHAPTLDLTRRALYIATGDGYTEPAPRTTDAVMALDMETGRILWTVQDTENDAWLVGCAQQPTENCPKNLGPDFDFGAPPILSVLPDGRRMLVAGQKSGRVFAHDPDRRGELAWTATLVDKAGDAEILFGGAADQQSVFFGLDNGTLTALDTANGKQQWSASVTSSASRRGLTAALTVIPGVVFSGSQDGTLRAFSADTGRLIWSYNTLQDFKTVNGVVARGGSMGAPGPIVVGGMLFVGSGYVGLGNGTPGNVLLAFGVE